MSRVVMADENANLLDARSWTETPAPVFTTNTATGQYGPGHNSFTTVGDQDVLVCLAHDTGRLVVAKPGGDRWARERVTFRAS